MRIKHLFIPMLILAITLISGCDGTSYSDTFYVQEVPAYGPVHGAGTSYNIASVHGMAPGEWYHFELAGQDSYGDAWHGSVTRSGLAGRWVDGVWATPTVTQIVLTHEPSGSTIQRSRTLYLDNYGQEVKLALDNGVACYPTVTNDIPLYGHAGDYGELGIMACTDGSELHGIWDLYSNPDPSADFVTLSTFWYGNTAESSTQVTQTLNPDGLIIGYAISLYVPEYSATLWLESR